MDVARDPLNLVRFVSQNPAATELIGVDPDELATRLWTDFVPVDRHAQIEENFLAALDGEPRSFETQFLHAAGRRVDVAVTYIPIVVDGEVTGRLPDHPGHHPASSRTGRPRVGSNVSSIRSPMPC